MKQRVKRLLGGALGSSMLLAVHPAAAQTADQLQQQIQQLQRQLQQLQNQVDEQARRAPPPAAPAAAPAPAGGARVTMSPANRPGISSADGQNTIELTGRLHFDIADYLSFRPFAIDLGYLDVPFTLVESTSSNDIMFIARSSSNIVATGLAATDARSALGVRWNTDRAWAGAYVTGPTA